MARSDPQVNFRIPADLKDALDIASEASGRSLTAEIVARLQMSFEGGGDAGVALALKTLSDVIRELGDQSEGLLRSLDAVAAVVDFAVREHADFGKIGKDTIDLLSQAVRLARVLTAPESSKPVIEAGNELLRLALMLNADPSSVDTEASSPVAKLAKAIRAGDQVIEQVTSKRKVDAVSRALAKDSAVAAIKRK